MSEQQSSYRQIMKATSIFGGVQVFNILIQIIRSKVIAILLGPTGMGIMGLLTSTTGLITSITNFGLGTSGVKNIAEAHSKGNPAKIAHTLAVFKNLIWYTGVLGVIVCLCLSPWLSQLTFGNRDYNLAFVWLSVTLLFSQLSSGQLVILQGFRQLKYLAKANVLGSALGLIITLPLYYIYKIDGIVPGIIGSSVATLLLAWFYANKLNTQKATVTRKETVKEGKEMLKMGFLISLSGLLTVGASYIIRVYINKTGGTDQVGLYTAGFAIINNYVGLIFNAMATDYYPRLSAIAHDNKLCQKTINQQAEIAILILAPILMIFFVFIDWAVILLYSKQFLAINVMIYWAALGMFFKAASWSIAFIFLAKGTSKLFFWNELTANIYVLTLNIFGYQIWGLTGLGISFMVAYFVYLVQVFLISKKYFKFSFEKEFVKLFCIQFILAIICFLIISFIPKPYTYIIGTILVGISGWFSVRELDKRLNLKQILLKFQKH